MKNLNTVCSSRFSGENSIFCRAIKRWKASCFRNCPFRLTSTILRIKWVHMILAAVASHCRYFSEIVMKHIEQSTQNANWHYSSRWFMGNRLRRPRGPGILWSKMWSIMSVFPLLLSRPFPFTLAEGDVGGEKWVSKRISGNKLDVIIMRGSFLLHTHTLRPTHTQVELSKAETAVIFVTLLKCVLTHTGPRPAVTASLSWNGLQVAAGLNPTPGYVRKGMWPPLNTGTSSQRCW